jgi:hypothetical protein
MHNIILIERNDERGDNDISVGKPTSSNINLSKEAIIDDVTLIIDGLLHVVNKSESLGIINRLEVSKIIKEKLSNILDEEEST